MSTTPFKAGGALTDEHTAIYIERQSDRDVLIHLRAMDYLLVIEPRQQGKTSLINHLMCHPALGDRVFAYVDVTTPDRSTEAGWYQTFCPRILRQLRGLISRNQWPTFPEKSAGWREFLCDVAMFATDTDRRVVIALDEIGAMTFPGATEFFSVLRDVYNSRQAETELKQVTFLLVGAFHPRDLIKDDKISPFNIAHRLRLPDFTLAQVSELVSKGRWSDEQADALAQHIHYWTDGQPYLTQLLCSYLGPDATPADVDAGVERLRREDENHLPPLLERLNSDKKLCEYVRRIQAGECIKFYPQENRRQAQLELLGIIKDDVEGYCVIRNRIYEMVLSHHDRSKPWKPAYREENEEPINIPHELVEQLQKGNVVLFVGADLPASLTGLPTRVDLAASLADERLSVTAPSPSWPEVAAQYEAQAGKIALIGWLQDQLDPTGRRPGTAYRLLAQLPVTTFITTTYDTWLHQALTEVGRRPNLPVVDADSLGLLDSGRPTVVKLFGVRDWPDSLVLTTDDLQKLPQTKSRLLAGLVQPALSNKTVLIFGQNLRDTYFQNLYQTALSKAGPIRPLAYAVWQGLAEWEKQVWRDRGVSVIEAPVVNVLGQFIW
jgi:hypothetical protein